MANDAPLLSIVTPCLNAASHLPKALESVAGQPVAAGVIEHIVMDGGSADGSGELIARHAALHPRLVTGWRSEPDRGQSDAINKGLALARGTFGAWLNADDWYEPDGLTRVVETLRADPAIDVLVGRCRFVNAAGETVFSPRPPEPIDAANLLSLRSRWFNGRCLVQPEVVFRLSLFRAVGGLSPGNHHTMDYELWLRLLAAGAKFVAVDVPVACLGVHAGQKTADNRAVVRSILGVAAPALERCESGLGERAAVVRAELASMQRKLRIADALISRWERGPRGGVSGDQSAVAAYADAVCGRRDGWESARDALCRPAIDALAALLAEPLMLGRVIRVAVVTAGTTAGAAAVLGRLRRKRLEIALLGVGPAQFGAERARLAEALGADRVAAGSLIGSGAWRHGPGGFDLLITEDFWTTRASPGEAMSGLAAVVRRGGLWLQLPEPRPVRTLERYLEHLRRRLADQLSANDEVVLAPAADVCLGRIEAEEELVPGFWSNAHPGGRGVDLPSAVERAGAPFRPLAFRAFGGLHHHPLTPFPFVGPPALSTEDAWAVSVWRRV